MGTPRHPGRRCCARRCRHLRNPRVRSSGNGPSYRLGTVSKGSVDQTLTLSGTVEKASQATSSFKVSGTVTSVQVAIGDQVNAGEDLATLDPTALQRAVTAAQATLAQAQATLAADERLGQQRRLRHLHHHIA